MIKIIIFFMAFTLSVFAEDTNQSPLHRAIIDDNIDVIETLITEGVDINEKDKFGVNALMLASKNGNERLVKMFIEEGADVNEKDNNKTSVLHFAKNIKIVNILIDAGADINAINKWGHSPLYYAKDKESVKKYIKNGVNIDVKENNSIPAIFYISLYGDEEVAIELVKQKADIDIKFDENVSLLHIAIARGHNKFATELIKRDLDPSAIIKKDATFDSGENAWTIEAGSTPLTLATAQGKNDKKLISTIQKAIKKYDPEKIAESKEEDDFSLGQDVGIMGILELFSNLGFIVMLVLAIIIMTVIVRTTRSKDYMKIFGAHLIATKYSITEKENKKYFEIVGRPKGLLGFIFSLLKIDVLYTIKNDEKGVHYSSKSPFYNFNKFTSYEHIESISTAYGRNIFLIKNILFFIIVLIFIIYLKYFLFIILVLLVLALLSFLYYNSSRIMLQINNGNFLSIRFNESVLENTKINIESIKKVAEILENEIAKK